MATSGSASVSVTSHDTMKISWTLNSQSTSNNTSSITFKAELTADSSGKISSSASKSYTATINGTEYTGTNTVGISSGKTITLFSKTLTLSHSSDGTLSFTYKFKQEFGITFSGSYVSSKSASCTVSPTDIPRASSISSAGNVTLGNACSIKWTPNSTSFAYKIKFSCGSVSYTTDYISPKTTSAYTYTGYTMSIATWAPAITSSTTGTCTATLYTYTSSSSSSSMGSSQKTFTLTVPSSVKPTVSIGSTAEGNSDVTLGVYVKSMSKVKVTFTGTSVYSSSLKSYTLTIGSSTYTGSCSSGSSKTVTSGTLTSSGSVSIKVTVTDARGRTSDSASTSITVQDYSAPNISSFSVVRCDSSGTEDPTGGTYAKIVYAYSCSSLNSKNSASMNIMWKDSSSSDYSNTVTTGTGLSGSATLYPTTVFPVDYGYTFQISVTDVFSTSTRTITMPTAIYPISVYKTGFGIAFGKAAEEENLMDVQYPSKFRNNITIENDLSESVNSMLDIINDGDSGNTMVRYLSYSGKRMNTGVGAGGQARGIYDINRDQWILYANSVDDLYLSYPDGNYKPYYAAGDTITSSTSLYTAGFVTSSSASVRFTIPLTRPIVGSPTISISGDLQIRQDGNYTHGSSSGSGVSPSSWSVTSLCYGIRVDATMSSTTNAVNNAPCGILATLTITLS